ncbi:HEAT repeat domain-containing protein [Streptomyces sp. NPDC059104]|uniref:HEAT repeat domain-containing protein n=1 Tax=Streptomyces sp. NPDC059104 TaxID=3346729 RepID=UPI0036A8A094
MRSEESGTEAWERYGAFLRTQAEEAGMSARDIAEAFAAADRPGNGTTCSKSHIDRLFNGRAKPKPPAPFTIEFLGITGQATRLTQQEHRRRCDVALSLLRTAMAKPPAAPTPRTNGDDTAAALRLERDLARKERDLAQALHAETRLRYALRDAEILLMTLCQITGALREIIAGNDVRALRSSEGQGLARLRDETHRAVTHKATAQQEADLVTARMRVLEDLWDRARAEIRRLALHPDAAALTLPGTSSSAPPRPVPVADVFTQLALDDIAAALRKAHEVNSREEEAVRELHRAFGGDDGFLQPEDELTVLLTSTRFADHTARASAVPALTSTWRHEAAAREAVMRLATDPDVSVRQYAVDGLAEAWPGHPAVRDTLLRVAGDGDATVRHSVAEALRQGWPGDFATRDVILRLTDDANDHVRRSAVSAITGGWPGDPSARDVVLRLCSDREPDVRGGALEELAKGWPGDRAARDAVVRGSQDESTVVRTAALMALGRGWGGDPAAREAVWQLADEPGYRGRAVDVLAKGWPGDPRALRGVLRLAGDELASTRAAAASALADGWPGDPSAEDAVIRLAGDAHTDVRPQCRVGDHRRLARRPGRPRRRPATGRGPGGDRP